MILAVATLTWLALLVGSVAVCRAAAHGDAQTSLTSSRKDAAAEAHLRLRSRGVSGRGRLSLGVLARDGEQPASRRLHRRGPTARATETRS
jgi:hypothetical protein